MELKDKHIFILGLARFDGGIESTSYVFAKQLAKYNHVYYIDNPFTFVDYYRLKGTPQFKIRKKGFSDARYALIDSGVTNMKILITPVVPSIHFLPEGFFYRQCLALSEWRVRKRIIEICALLKIKEFIYVNSFNFHYPGIMDGLKPRLTIYQCLDPMIMPFDRKHGVKSEDMLVADSDLVVCSAKQLFVEKMQENPNTYYIPNAADVTHSSKALDPLLPVSDLIKNIPKPIIGYFGAIERRIDYDLVKQVVEANRDKSFVFCGPQDTIYMPEWFTQQPNLHLTGAVPYNELPAVLKGFDIALIPFKKDKVSATIFPLKLFEYLGAGKPVIATDFNPDLQEFTKDTVAYCGSLEAFNKSIERFLGENTGADIEKRLEVAKENTWERRTNDFADLLSKCLQKKNN